VPEMQLTESFTHCV